MSLRLPGQSPRAYRDYQARLLTDAVMTAIAVQEKFTDEFLAGLMPLLWHSTAIGLWQWAVAATSTAPENAIRDAAERLRSPIGAPTIPLSAEEFLAQKRLLLVAEALDEEAWHSPFRFTVAANIARDKLSGVKAQTNARILYEQGSEWDEIRQNMRHCTNKAWLWEGTSVSYDWSGRGGAAVWRAQRRVELQDFEDWLSYRPREGSPIERHLRPPGWLVRTPDNWCTQVLPPHTEIPEPFATWVATGRLLAFPAQERQVLWPLSPAPRPPGWVPVPGIEPVIAAAGGLRPDQISGFIEAVLVDWGSDGPEDEDQETVGRPRIPAHEAFVFGFIDADERRRASAEARAATLQRMTDIINSHRVREESHRAELAAARGNVGLFKAVIRRLRLRIDFDEVKATWAWPRRSLADEVLTGTPAEVVEWLARCFHRTCIRMLQHSMEQAWRDAFDHHPADHWYQNDLVTPTNISAVHFCSRLDADPPF
ncbi:MAG: hypothetical protein ACRDRV_02215 [Pseudonocardiaceae bacterium]